MPPKLRRILIAVTIVIAVVGVDQFTKEIARRALAYQPSVELLGGFVRFLYIENTGAFLGLGMSLPGAVRFWVFVVGTGMLLPVILMYAVFAGHLVSRQVIALSMGT
jgi:signal peptidase II